MFWLFGFLVLWLFYLLNFALMSPFKLPAQSALGVIGNIAFPSSRNKGKIVSPPFTEDEFTRSPSVAL